MFKLTLDDFEGPLDLLLHLIKREEINIFDVDISLIIDKYLMFINSFDKYDLDKRSEYLVMATDLILLKSKLLIGEPIQEDAEESDEITEESLKLKIAQYEIYKNLSESLRILEEDRGLYLTKEPSNLNSFTKEKKLLEADINSLINAMIDFEKRKKLEKPLITKVAKKEINLNEKILFIKNKLKSLKKISLFSLFKNQTRDEVIAVFLAALCMAKNGDITIEQKNTFSDIVIKGV